MLTAVGCYDRPIGWRHGLHSGSTWYAAARGSAVATPDLFGSVFQHRTLHQHHRQQHQHHYPPTAAAFATLLQQASSVVAPAAALVPYFQPQSNSDDTEKPIGCGAFGVVWYVHVWHWFLTIHNQTFQSILLGLLRSVCLHPVWSRYI